VIRASDDRAVYNIITNKEKNMTPITPAKELIAHLTLDDMLELNKFLVGRIKQERALVGQKMKRQLSVGSKVSFEDNDGWTVQGKIAKVMRKFAQVDTGATIWRVPLNALTKLEA
tara:strand:- start:410 stop:754 length:345 start_codon:yes stop_codon:yes gene_type:complete